VSLKESNPGWVPEETARVTKAAFPRGSLAIYLRDALPGLYSDALFADCFPRKGKPAEAPWRLALVTVLQFAYNLTDREAAEAVQSRIDWKYALGLTLEHPGFNYSVLSKFRKRLIDNQAETRLLDTLLQFCQEKQLLKARGTARTDSTHVLAKVKALNRWVALIETFRHTLIILSKQATEWLKQYAPSHWLTQYRYRFETFPAKENNQLPQAIQAGRDGFQLFTLIQQTHPALAQLPAVERLRQTWLQQFMWVDGQVELRSARDIPPASQMILSPYEDQARLGKKRGFRWRGYKVHFTEHCSDDSAHLVTHVRTTIACRRDNSQLSGIHQSLADKQLLPALHLVDAGYIDAGLILESEQQYEIELLGPTLISNHWQEQSSEAFHACDFSIDWENEQVTCPNGAVSTYWKPRFDVAGNTMIRVSFSKKHCDPCPQRHRCTQAKVQPRQITFRPQAEFEKLQAIRKVQNTRHWHTLYSKRSGIEGTLSQAIRAFGQRHARYRGLNKTHLQQIAIATALNLTRLAAWAEQKPRETTRLSSLGKLIS
jgi:transposase